MNVQHLRHAPNRLISGHESAKQGAKRHFDMMSNQERVEMAKLLIEVDTINADNEKLEQQIRNARYAARIAQNPVQQH